MTIRVLFVCLGNICRSPLAEGAFVAEAERIGLDVEVDSAGTGAWHVGNPPDERSQSVARKYGVDIAHQRARRVSPEDFERFEHIVALDDENLEALRKLQPQAGRAQLSLLLDHVEGREGEPVGDPYYGGAAGFETAWSDIVEGARALAHRIAGPGD